MSAASGNALDAHTWDRGMQAAAHAIPDRPCTAIRVLHMAVTI